MKKMFSYVEYLFVIFSLFSLCQSAMDTEFIQSFMYRMEDCNNQLENATTLISGLWQELLETRNLNLQLQSEMQVHVIFLITSVWCTHRYVMGGGMYVRGAKLKNCVIKGDNWSVKGPTKNLYILIGEVVLMTVLGGVFPNKWEYYGLP